MSVIGFGRVDKYGQKNNPDALERFLRRKLGSRGVDLEGVEFVARRGRKHPNKVIVDAFRGEDWIASANVDQYGQIQYSMPGTDRK